MTKYVVINKITKEVSNDLDDAITTRVLIDHLEKSSP